MRKILVIDPDKCVGCRLCEVACSFHHYKEFRPARSRILVLRNERLGIEIPMVCQQCEIPLCMEACPTDATYRDEKTGAMIIDEDKCIGCRLCLLACPLGGPSIDVENMKTIKCDLCDGDPECVKFCPREAIVFVPANRVSILKKKSGAEKISKLVSKIVTTQRGI